MESASKNTNSSVNPMSLQLDLFATNHGFDSEKLRMFTHGDVSEDEGAKLYDFIRQALDSEKFVDLDGANEQFDVIERNLVAMKRLRSESLLSCRFSEERKFFLKINLGKRPNDFLRSAKISRDGRGKDWSKVSSDFSLSYLKGLAELFVMAVPSLHKPAKKHARG